MVDENTMKWQGCCRDSLICMRSWLKGSGKLPLVPGSWHCYTCNLGNVDAQKVLKTLRGLGLSEDLLVQVPKSLQPPPTKMVSSRERQMA